MYFKNTRDKQGYVTTLVLVRLERILNQSVSRIYLVLLVALSLLSLPTALLAQTQTGAGQMELIGDDNQKLEAVLLNAKAHIEITGLNARVTLSQTFKNTTAQWREGMYLLPLPDNAAIDSLRIKTENSVIEGVIKEKQQAKRIYEKARQAGQKAALVQSERPDLFTTKVANIAPGSEIKVEVSYFQPVAFENNIFSIHLPNTLTPRYIPNRAVTYPDDGELDKTRQVAASGWVSVKNITPEQSYAIKDSHQITITASINSGMELAWIQSPSHQIVWKEQARQYQVALKNTQVPMNNNFVLSWALKAQDTPVAAVFTETYQGEDYINLMVMPPQFVNNNDVLAREMIFVIDSSGSMQGASMRQAKASLLKALALLSPQDKFNIIEFDQSWRVVFQQSQLANTQNLNQARDFVHSIQADGGTEIKPALEQAIKMMTKNADKKAYLTQMVFLTDGSVGNEQEIFGLIKNKLGQARLFTIAIGTAPNLFFMRKSARYGRGSFTHIAQPHEVEEKITRLFTQLKKPVLKDIEVQWQDGQAVEFYPNPVPDLYQGEPVMLYAKMTRPAQADEQQEVVIKGKMKHQSWSRKIQYHIVPTANPQQGNKGIAKLWARKKIEQLMDGAVMGISEEQIKAEVLPLALKHHLVSKYTSLVAVEKKISRDKEDPLKSAHIKNLMPKGSTMPYPSTATNAQLFQYLGLMALLLSLLGFYRARKQGRVPKVIFHENKAGQ